MVDKIVYTVSGYKILKDLQNEIMEENELESKFHNTSELHKSRHKDPTIKVNTLSSQKNTHPATIILTEMNSPNHNLLTSMKDNLNITSLLLKNKKPNTATGLTNERLKTLTLNSNFSTTNHFFTNKQTPFNQTQELDVTTLSRIVIRNSKKTKTPINVNETRNAMIPAGHSQLPSIIIHEQKLSSTLPNPNELLKLRHDEAKLEKIIASSEQKKKEIHEIDEIVKKKLMDKTEFNREYFNKKDPFWRNFFESNKVLDQFDSCNQNFTRRLNERIQGYQDDKYRRNWMSLRVGKHKSDKPPLIFGREDLRKFEEIFSKLKKGVKNQDETIITNPYTREELKRSRTNLSKISSETKMEKDGI